MSADAVVERAEDAAQRWRAALRAHQFAAPDEGFGERLAQLANAAEEQESAFRAADREGLSARPVPGARDAIQAPPELRPDSGRRGPVELWERFDRAFAAWDRSLEDTDIRKIADGFSELAAIARELAVAVDVQRAAPSAGGRQSAKPGA